LNCWNFVKIWIVKNSRIAGWLLIVIKLCFSLCHIYFHCKIIIFFVLFHLLLRIHKYFRKSTQIFFFILVSFLGLLSHQYFSLLWSIFLSLSSNHSLLNFFVFFNFTLFFPFLIDSNKIESICDEFFFNISI
jgi:hypothetical protein